ncbi:MAG TPA: hypothetical protein VK436_07540 [Methanocella sp.]|nr:hypothetical protein [Methanocella sp.]
MKSMEHRLWFLLFMTLGNGLVAMLLLLYGTEPTVRLLSLPLRYILIGPAVVVAYAFAMVVAVSSLLTPAMSDDYVLRLKRRLISNVWVFWTILRLGASLFFIGVADLIWICITAYYSLYSQSVQLGVFEDRFGILLGLMNLIVLTKVFLSFIYNRVSRKWPVVLIDGLASLAVALILSGVMVISPFNGLMPIWIVLVLRLIMGAFMVVQATDAAARIARSAEYRIVEKQIYRDILSDMEK